MHGLLGVAGRGATQKRATAKADVIEVPTVIPGFLTLTAWARYG
jgi:hypothetical protein